MARNEEKQYGRLNRLHLQQQREEQLKKKPPRPKLHTLNSVSDVKKWLPSITRDIDFNLKQSEVTCYPEAKIREFRDQVQRLQGEYWAFVRKIKQLDPQCDVVPWTERGYTSRKRPADAATNVTMEKASRLNDRENGSSQQPLGLAMTASERLALPLVDNEKLNLSTNSLCQPDVIRHCPYESQDTPLQFTEETPTTRLTPTSLEDKPLQFTRVHRVTYHMKEVYSAAMTSVARQDACRWSDGEEEMEVVEPAASLQPATSHWEHSPPPCGTTNPLGIDYESSSSSSS